MNDDQILDYLRARARHDRPLDFVGSVVSAVADAPQRRASWITPFLPTAAVLGAAAGVAVALLLLNQNPIVSVPDPTDSASPSPVASEQPAPTLLEPGDSVTLDAVDPTGVWGTITIERLEIDTIAEPSPGDARSIQFEIAYEAERMPSPAEFGAEDWTVALASDGSTVARGALILLIGASALETYPQGYPETRDIFTEPIEGRVSMPLPAEVAEADLDLVYRPSGFATPVIIIPLQRVDTLPDPTPAADDRDLLTAGRTISLPIRSEAGAAGRITIERGEDIGGYPLVLDPSSESHFYIELLATYEMDIAPETAQWGDLDWRIEGADGAIVHAELVRAILDPEGRRGLGTWPGATVPEERYSGWMVFAVPRDAAAVPLELVYAPPGVAEVTRYPVRNPADPPAPVAAEWPYTEPTYVAKAELPFTVIESAEADVLFVDADTCTNPEGGYTVSYPDSWYTNTDLDNVPACSWFSPTFYELNESGNRPKEIALEIGVFEGAVGFIWADLYSEQIMLDGIDARRAETGMTKGPETPTDTFQYDYLANLDTDADGRKLWAFTGTEYGGDYELAKAVLDRIMASLEFTD